MTVNLGCGERRIEGAQETVVNVDFRKTSITDVVHDLRDFPWPFSDEQFERAYALDIIEHMLEVVPFLDEVWRILRPGGALFIRTTYFEAEQSYSDPTHCHYFTLDSFDYFDPETVFGKRYHWYSTRKWHVVDRALCGQDACFELRKEI